MASNVQSYFPLVQQRQQEDATNSHPSVDHYVRLTPWTVAALTICMNPGQCEVKIHHKLKWSKWQWKFWVWVTFEVSPLLQAYISTRVACPRFQLKLIMLQISTCFGGSFYPSLHFWWDCPCVLTPRQKITNTRTSEKMLVFPHLIKVVPQIIFTLLYR